MQTGNYQALAVILLLLHPLCFLLSFLLFDRCEFKTPKLKKRLMRKSLVANAAINISLLFFCPALLFPGRGAGGIVADALHGSCSYQDISRLGVSSFLCLLLSMLLTLLCCALYHRLWDDRMDTSPRQRGLLLCALAMAAVPAMAGIAVGGNGASVLRLTDICRRYEAVETDESTGNVYSENFSYIVLRNTGAMRCDADSLYLSAEADDLRQVPVPAFSLDPDEEYTLVLPDNESLQIKKAGGSTVYLSNAWGTVLDQVTVPALEKGAHYRKTGADWSVQVLATVTDEAAPVAVPAPEFSAESGFYDAPFELTLSAAPGLTVYYTLDCSEPSAESTAYSTPIAIYDRSGEPNQYAKRADFRNDYLEVELDTKPVKKCMVVRAVAVDAEGNASPAVTASYFIGALPVDPEKTAVLSVVSSPDGLIGPEGILVTGSKYDEWYRQAFRNTPAGQTVDKKDKPMENYYRHGPEWERAADMQLFSQGELLWQQPVGIRAQGFSSRSHREYKRLSIYSRPEYGGSAFFPSGVINDLRQHSLVIRFGRLHALSQLLCQGRNCAVSDFKTVAYYLNGEYLYTGYLHEKFNEKNMAEKYGLTDTNIAIVTNGQVPEEALRGENPISNVPDYIDKYDMSIAENYQEFGKIIDVQSYIDYLCINSYLANMDTNEFGENSLQYHTIVVENSGVGDTRWRWGLIDMDIVWLNEVSGIYADTPWQINAFTMAGSVCKPICEYELYSALKVNPAFCHQFVLTFMDLVNTIFTADNTTKLLDEMNIENVQYREFFARRAEYAVKYLAEEFALTGTEEAVTLSSNRSGAPIRLNTVQPELNDGAWSGDYFTDYPVTVTANGAGFDHWEVTRNGVTETYTEPSIEVPVTKGGVQIHAVFQ